MPPVRTTKALYLDTANGNNSPRFYIESKESIPAVDKHSVLIQVKACALKLIDIKVLRELFRKKPSNPNRFSIGQDISGIVKQTGSDVATLQVDDEVVGIIPLDYELPGCAEYVVLHELDVVRKPENVSFVEAAGSIGDAVKAYTALHYQGRMTSGDSVLVLDGASGFGTIAIQLAHHWGAKCFATYSTEEERLYLKTMLKDTVQIIELQKKGSNLKTACLMETGQLGVDIILDQGAIQYPQQSSNIYDENRVNSLHSKHDIISSLAIGGRWVTSKSNLQLDPSNSRLLFMKCASIGFLFEQAWMLTSAQQGKYQHILMDIMDKLSTKVVRENPTLRSSFMPVPKFLRPKSRGTITLKSSDPKEYPIIRPNYLTHPDDVKAVIDGVKFGVRMSQTNAFKKIGAKFWDEPYPLCKQHAVTLDNDDYWECLSRHMTSSIYHPAGTCKMGSKSDKMAVVDDRLKLHGLEGLRVSDASIMPHIISGNINAPCIMIGERTADFIKEEYGKKVDEKWTRIRDEL